jgi:hypothetical protein
MAAQGIVAVELARRLALKVLRNHAALVVGWMVSVLASIGTNQGWMHGAFEFAMLSVLGLYLVGLPVTAENGASY